MCSGCVKWEASCHQTACSPLGAPALKLGHTHTQLSHTHNLVTHTHFHTYNFVTHIFHTHLSHNFITHTQLFKHNFFNFSILHHLLCLSFLPRPASTFVSAYWKKLTCGVIRSFDFSMQILEYLQEISVFALFHHVRNLEIPLHC